MNFNILNALKSIDLTSIIKNTNKTLNVVKKSIPVYREIRPYIKKEKKLFNNKPKDTEFDEIKMSKPLKVDKEPTYNDSLTFFQ